MSLATFNTHVKGIPCQCVILDATPYVPMYVNPRTGEATEPEGGEIDFELRDRKGYLAMWLHKKLDAAEEARITEEARIILEGQLREFALGD